MLVRSKLCDEESVMSPASIFTKHLHERLQECPPHFHAHSHTLQGPERPEGNIYQILDRFKPKVAHRHSGHKGDRMPHLHDNRVQLRGQRLVADSWQIPLAGEPPDVSVHGDCAMFVTREECHTGSHLRANAS